MYTILADLVLIIHTLYVLFIIGGLLVVVAGGIFGWAWIRNFWFRAIHLIAIASVVLLSWLQIICPLTAIEAQFRLKAVQPAYEKTFIAHWLHEILFYDAPGWVFSVGYTAFGLLVAITWIYITPDLPWRKTLRGS